MGNVPVGMERPKFTRYPDGRLTASSCCHLIDYFLYQAKSDGDEREITLWSQLQRSFELAGDYDLEPWTTCPMIERRLKEDKRIWDKLYVPWEERHRL